MKERSEKIIIGLWLVGYFLVFLAFLPIKGDKFVQYPPVYGYFFATLLLIWVAKLIVKSLTLKTARNLTIIIILFAFLYPVISVTFNGKLFFIRNAAEYNYPTVLYLFLDTSNQKEIDLAIFYAKEGGNVQIVEDLKKNE